LNENSFNPRILYPAKLSLKIDEPSHNYKRFSKDFCIQKIKTNKTMKGQAIPNHKKRNGKKVESNVDSAAHNQTLKQQRQLYDKGSPPNYQY
jgi:hypothetical protein